MSAPSDLPLVVGARIDGEGWAVRMTMGDGQPHDMTAETARRLAADLSAVADVIEGRHASLTRVAIELKGPMPERLEPFGHQGLAPASQGAWGYQP